MPQATTRNRARVRRRIRRRRHPRHHRLTFRRGLLRRRTCRQCGCYLAVYDHERGAAGLATILALTAAMIAALLTLVGAVDVVATIQRGQHAADVLAIAAMERSPLAGGAGTIDQTALTALAKHRGVQLIAVDTTSWPLEVGVRVRAGPYTSLASFWTGPELSARAEAVPPPVGENRTP